MRIVIDMQGAQTESRFRGIGRYSLSFAQAVVRNRGDHEVILALNGLFPDTIEPIRAAFDGLLPQKNVRVWHAPGPVREVEPSNDLRRETAELIREAFLASLQPDVIHVTSLFEGFVDEAVTSIGRFDQSTPVSVALYDLIPLRNPEHYLKPNPSYEQYYLRKINHLRQAASCLAISGFSREECIDTLGMACEKIFNVSTAIDSYFQPQIIAEADASAFLAKHDITRPFVLYTGGSDDRKNLPRLIEAYAALPEGLRDAHQLVFAGRMPNDDIARFRRIASAAGMTSDDLIFTGYITDEELVQLYNLGRLYVFPSWHEGFGLPALEAMACGAAVIGANTSSLPEVIGLDEALFDPFDVQSITAKLAQALQDETFCKRLREHGQRQAKKFSWDEAAMRAIAAWELLQSDRPGRQRPVKLGRKPRLAFVSPMPPERTGIADYSAELLPALSSYYDIDLVVAQDRVVDQSVKPFAKVRDVAWLRAHAGEVGRVLYQMGNSPFHQHMLSLMAEIPGVVVLHDFYLSGLMAWLELVGGVGPVWSKAVYETYGYRALQIRQRDADAAKKQFPVNGHVLQHALGIVVHSEFSRDLARQWYGENSGNNWRVIPHLRTPSSDFDRGTARKQLGFEEPDVLICSFGFLDPSKLNHRLLQAWLKSALASEGHCHLVFVGENHGGDYGAALINAISSNECGKRIRISGFASPELFRQYLAAADIAVQLRAQSRGETSGTVLDCMNHGVPVIVNAHGSMAELDRDAVWMLPDEFDDAALVDALEQLWRSPEKRFSLGDQARKHVRLHHAPDVCAKQYAEAIEACHVRAAHGLPELIRLLALDIKAQPSDDDLVQLACALSRNHPLPRSARRLYLDVTATCRHDLRTGIERVARALIVALLESTPRSYLVDPVYLSHENGRWVYRYARRYTLGLMTCPADGLEDEIVEPEAGDVLLGLDLSGDLLVQAEQSGLFRDFRNQGVLVYAIVFDLLPVRMPEVFPPGADRTHHEWLETISRFDGAVCISKAVADDLRAWQENQEQEWENRRPYHIGWFHLGADVFNSAPSRGLPPDANDVLKKLKACPCFLMVGTIEPRKGYLQTIHAFEQLWKEGVNVNLVIVGREGWQGLPDSARRDIPQTVERLRNSPEFNSRLCWLEGISDEYLEKVYAASTCLIAASYGEGFGLPLIEAAQHKLPIIARNIPVFREVAAEYAYYFQAETVEELASSIREWLGLYSKNLTPEGSEMPWLTWEQSARKLVDQILPLDVSHKKVLP